jgi:glycine cleavage system H protein
METYYSKEHEWVKIKEGVASVGITEYAAHQLGDITFVDLPKLGKVVKQFEVLAGIESVKAASDIYAPVSGKVVKVNEVLNTTPEIVNEAAEDAGWLAWLEVAEPLEVKNLMTRSQYDEFVKGLA